MTSQSQHHQLDVVAALGKKREGLALDDDEIEAFVQGFASGAIPDYQCSAFLMAVCCRGMNARETAALTRAMKESGATADLSDIPGPKVDKHSTGGVGDKTSLILAPIVASLGGVVPMMSGRGLEHTGGTLDKLESIPGFRVALAMSEFKEQLRSAGAAIISTTADIAPADKKMYALRDVTSTVTSLPLITGSIMCKKLAEGPDSLVLDVKTGEGAFMKTEEAAIELAQSMIAAGEGDGKWTTAFITAMDQPLGRAVGNWLEVVESLKTLAGEGPADLTDLSVTLAAQMLVQAHAGSPKKRSAYATLATASEAARAQLHNGEALAAFRKMVEAQGGDVSVLDQLAASPCGPAAPSLISGAQNMEIYQAVYGEGAAKACSLAEMKRDAADHGHTRGHAHGCFWTGACQGLEGCRDLDAFFRRAYGLDKPADGDRQIHDDLERSLGGPHGPVVARVEGLDALEVGRACVHVGSGREVVGEELSLGSGILLHKKMGDTVRQGDVLFTLFAEVGGTRGASGSRRIIDRESVDKACARILSAYSFKEGTLAELNKPAELPPLVRFFVDRDGTPQHL